MTILTQPSKSFRAFTLLEMMLAIGVFLLLIGSAFGLVGATTELMTEVSQAQNSSSHRLRLLEVCRTAIESSSTDSSLEFHYFDRGNEAFDTYLTLVNSPGAFDFGANFHDEITHITIASEIRTDGLIRVGVYYMTEDDYAVATDTDFETLESRYIELVPRMRVLTWRFYDEDEEKWESTLDGNLSANLIELTIQMNQNSPTLQSVFYRLNSQ